MVIASSVIATCHAVPVSYHNVCSQLPAVRPTRSRRRVREYDKSNICNFRRSNLRQRPPFVVSIAALLLRISLLLCSLSYLTGFLPYIKTSFLATSRNALKVTRQQDQDKNAFDMDYDGDGSLTSQTFRERYTNHLPTWLLDKCDDCGYIYPTRIQEKVLDEVFVNQCTDIIVQSETGSGKTLSFLLPCFANIDASRSTVQVLIVVPTRELGLQIARVAKRLATSITTSNNNNNYNKIMIMSILQGSQNRRQRAWAWAEPPHVVIGTPEELCTMIRNGGIKRYNSIKYLVVDEVDACLLNNIGKVSSSTALQFAGTPLHDLLSKYLSPTYDDGKETMESDSVMTAIGTSTQQSQHRPILKSRTTIFCSATIPQHRYFAKQCIQNQWMLQTPTYISLQTGSQLLPNQIKHTYIVVSETEKKLSILRRTIKKLMLSCQATNEAKRILIFTDANRPLEEMAKVMATDINAFYYNEQSISSSSSKAQLSTTTSYQALVSVLRYEDSLSQRSIAMDALRGTISIGSSSSNRIRSNIISSNNHTTDDEDDDGNTSTTTRHDETQSISLSSSNNILLRILLSSDLAARGLDIVDITHVIHMDIPDSADIYVHRSGRTGRLGRMGQVLSIITPEQEFVLQRLTNKLQVDMTCIGRQQKQGS